jgi:hypothetical protein
MPSISLPLTGVAWETTAAVFSEALALVGGAEVAWFINLQAQKSTILSIYLSLSHVNSKIATRQLTDCRTN